MEIIDWEKTMGKTMSEIIEEGIKKLSPEEIRELENMDEIGLCDASGYCVSSCHFYGSGCEMI